MTITEILIASAVLSVFMLVGYRVFISYSHGFARGNWALTTQNRIRNALNFVREEMQKASHKTSVLISGVDVQSENHEFMIKRGEDMSDDGLLAEWTIGIPFRPTADPNPGATYRCRLELSSGRLLYSKELYGEGTDPLNLEQSYNDYVLLENVTSISLNYENFDPDDPSEGFLVTISVEVRHPDTVRYANMRSVSQTGAKVEVEVLEL